VCSLSFQKIKDVAIALFCERGYEGASLADIAELVGIKKSSIYNHYKNKDDLFLHIFEKSCQEEIVHVKNVLSKEKIATKEQFMQQFLTLSKKRIINNVGARFIFRFTMFPPHHFVDVLGIKITQFMEDLHQVIFNAIEESNLFSHLSTEEFFELASHYTILLQGTYVEGLTHSFGMPSSKIEPAWNHFGEIFINTANKNGFA
jgi:AcrR family transcriptional regulator